MPAPSVTETRLKNIITCYTVTTQTLGILARNVKVPFMMAISNTTLSLMKNIQTVKQNKDECIQLMEKTHQLLEAIITVYINSETGGELAPSVLYHIGRFTQTLHQIHTFVEAQQSSSRFKMFFRQSEMSILLRDCKTGLEQGLNCFQIKVADFFTAITKMQEDAQKRQQEVLKMVESLSEASNSDRASSISEVYSGAYASSASISMLPPEPKIFHGRKSELSEILELFHQGTPRIAILGAGGMGKTSLAGAVVHHTDIITRYRQHQHFVVCNSAANKVELAALIGAHLGLNPGKDLTQGVIQHLSNDSPSLLILDNLETAWEPVESRKEIEEFLSLLTGVEHLALMITMRGAERPGKVRWSHPFLQPLKPLDQDAARKTFIDIADSTHELTDIDKILSLTDNMPLAISLLAHLVDVEGCTSVLSHWEADKTSLISHGHDKRSNIDLSISLSLSSPRFNLLPQAKDLLSLLSMLPDGLSDGDLVQSKLPLRNILGCKAVLIRTTLAYSDEHKRLKVLVPIREYMQKIQPPGDDLIRPLLKHFQELLEFHKEYFGTLSGSSIVSRISSNFANIQNILRSRLQVGHPDVKDSIYCLCILNSFSRSSGKGLVPLIGQINHVLPLPHDYELEANLMTERIYSWRHYPMSEAETQISQALSLLELLPDTDIKCKLFDSLANYYEYYKSDLSMATKFWQNSILLASSTANTKRQAEALNSLSWIKWQLGDYHAARMNAYDCQQLARASGDLLIEASSLRMAAITWYRLGNYRQSISLCNRAIHLLGLCGISGGGYDYAILNSLAEAHILKSEYIEATDILTQIRHKYPPGQHPYSHGLAILNIADTGIIMDTAKEEVQQNIDAAKSLFIDMWDDRLIIGRECVQAALDLREGDMLGANRVFCKHFRGQYSDIASYCIVRLADVTRWNGFHGVSTWPTVFLVHSRKSKDKLGIYKAIQYLGDVFYAQDDEETAVALFTVALEGFTYMDVHRGRAECMLWLGNISKGHRDLLKAVELWETARPLFERSSQAKQVNNIDVRLASIGQDVLDQHRANLAYLVELKAAVGTAEEVDNDLSNMEEDLEVLNLGDEQNELVLV